MISTTCPKCGYARKPADNAPAWQCPSCGIAYSKFRNAAEQPRAESSAGPAAADLRERTLSEGRGDLPGGTAMAWYVGVLLVFMPLFFLTPMGFGAYAWLPVPIAACAFYFWLSAYRRLRMVEDVPTSTIAAAAQGYIELRGIAAQAAGSSLVGHLTRVPCIWYRYAWYTSGKNGQNDGGARGAPFILRDATGDCLVDSDQAEVICDRCQQWSSGGTVCQEWSIRAGDPVYAIGHFTSGGAAAERHVDMKVAYALAAQERDAKTFAARYDADKDGRVDRQEAALARDAVRREAMQQHAGQGGVHTLGPSPDGRPFLVIGASHERIASRYRQLAMVHLCMFLAALGLAVYLLR